MQTIKGLIALVLVGTAVFVVVGLNNIKSQDEVAAKFNRGADDEVAQTGEMTTQAATQADAKETNVTTNTVHQARQKVSSKHL